jgi:hypothetical protein
MIIYIYSIREYLAYVVCAIINITNTSGYRLNKETYLYQKLTDKFFNGKEEKK